VIAALCGCLVLGCGIGVVIMAGFRACPDKFENAKASDADQENLRRTGQRLEQEFAEAAALKRELRVALDRAKSREETAQPSQIETVVRDPRFEATAIANVRRQYNPLVVSLSAGTPQEAVVAMAAVVAVAERISLNGCPEDFIQAYREHLRIWRRMSDLAEQGRPGEAAAEYVSLIPVLARLNGICQRYGLEW